jgi:hypothetical protein
MTEFNIDLLHPGQFARTWVDWFLGPQGWRRLGVAYAIVVLFVLVPIAADYYFLGLTAQHLATLTAERRIETLQQRQIAERQNEVTQQEIVLRSVSELETFQIAWAAVLHALSERIPKDFWLKRIELVQPEAKPSPQAAPGAAPAARPAQIFRLEVATELKLGSAPFLGVAGFLDGLEQDRRFSKQFQMQDWETSSEVVGSGEQSKQWAILTVSFKKLP